MSVSGTDITVTQTSGAYLNGNGALWWDGGGSDSGKTKPKFFAAHNMISSTISDIYVSQPYFGKSPKASLNSRY